MKLPEVAFFEDFYFWFNTETKIEYYATPLYFYKASYRLANYFFLKLHFCVKLNKTIK